MTEALGQFFLRHCLKQYKRCLRVDASRDEQTWREISRSCNSCVVASAAARSRRRTASIASVRCITTITVLSKAALKNVHKLAFCGKKNWRNKCKPCVKKFLCRTSGGTNILLVLKASKRNPATRPTFSFKISKMIFPPLQRVWSALQMPTSQRHWNLASTWSARTR